MVWCRACRTRLLNDRCKIPTTSHNQVRTYSDSILPINQPPESSFSIRKYVVGSPDQEQPSIKQKKSRLHETYSPNKIIFSGIQPTGIPHLGNYLGALRQWKQLQDEKTRDKDPRKHRLLFSIVDSHALTHYQDPAELRRRRKETFASLLAIGLDRKHSHLFFQSEIREHTQLMWYLSNVASTGYLGRMTQWKAKLGVSEKASIDDRIARDKLKLGLFSYPVLQAADILLYDTSVVPVGEDQEQHVEFTRNLARSFNAQYRDANEGRDFFKVPTALISPARRIMSLRDPAAKMSKSHTDERSRILITDSPEQINDKFRSAITDSIEGISYDPQSRPAVSNLIEILKHVGNNNNATCEEIAADNANLTMRAFKTHVAEQVCQCLAGIRDRFQEVMHPDNDEMETSRRASHRIVAAYAGSKIAKMEMLMGLRSKDETPRKPKRNDESSKKAQIIREQEEEKEADEQEPDVLPQKEEGVDIPIAS